MSRVVVLGSINRDLMLTVDRLPVPGETVTASRLEVLSGGKGANQAAAAAAIGGSVALAGLVGTDAAGPEQVSALAAAGVDVSFVRPDPRAPTGTAVVMVDGAGHNSIVVVPGANGLLDAAGVERAAPLIEGARVLLLQLEIPSAAVERAVSIARRAGVVTILNIAPYREVPAQVLRGVDYLLANETEAAALVGSGVSTVEEAARAAEAMRRLGPRLGDHHARCAGHSRRWGRGVDPRAGAGGGCRSTQPARETCSRGCWRSAWSRRGRSVRPSGWPAPPRG